MFLKGRVFIQGQLELLTDLLIGSNEVGEVDMLTVKGPDGEPYIPGSSYRGKLRVEGDMVYHGELLEKTRNQLKDMADGKKDFDKKLRNVGLPDCKDPNCWLCNVFGRASNDKAKVSPTRLKIRDFLLYSGGKTLERSENTINRLTEAANPREREFVARNSVFDIDMVFDIYSKDCVEEGLSMVPMLMAMAEDRGLGANTSRGAGKIGHKNLSLLVKPTEFYENGDSAKKVLGRDNISDFQKSIKESLDAIWDEFK